MPFLVMDDRFASPVHVFLTEDPTAAPGFPPLPVRVVALDIPAGHLGGVAAVGIRPGEADTFRAFPSDAAVAAAGWRLVEPFFVGPSWAEYAHHFRPSGTPTVGTRGRVGRAAIRGRGHGGLRRS